MRDLRGDATTGLGDRFRHGATVDALISDGLAHLGLTQVPPLFRKGHALLHGELVNRMRFGNGFDHLAHTRLGASQLGGNVPLLYARNV